MVVERGLRLGAVRPVAQDMHVLIAREYKLLLNVKSLGSEASTKAANQFWKETIAPVIRGSIGNRASGKPRYAKSFNKSDRRQVIFYDDLQGTLNRNFYALRSRAPRSASDSEVELTLKYRMPDYFVVAGTPQMGAVAGTETQLEEDIAPLEVAASGDGFVTSDPASARSRFSLSTTLMCNRFRRNASLSSVTGLFPGLKSTLQKSTARLRTDTKLVAGPRIAEDVFKGPKVILGDKQEAKFSLTYWRFFNEAPIVSIAEVSYRCAMPDGKTTRDAARRAYDLFVGLQDGLGDLLERRYSSKTALALPHALT